ncbi:RNA polymerase sigma factor, partial [Streptomyces xantholiticus]
MCISFAITLRADDEYEKAAEAEEVASFCSDRSGAKGIVDIQPRSALWLTPVASGTVVIELGFLLIGSRGTCSRVTAAEATTVWATGGSMEDRALHRLVDECLAGSQESWNRIVDRYTPLIWAIARGHRLSEADCEDVCQITWMRVIQHLGKL